jgi:hypothetical protein
MSTREAHAPLINQQAAIALISGWDWKCLLTYGLVAVFHGRQLADLCGAKAIMENFTLAYIWTLRT